MTILGMSLPQMAGGIAGVATIATILWGAFRFGWIRLSKSSEQVKEDIDHQMTEEEKKVKETGRPQ